MPNYPSSLDSLSNPGPTTTQDEAGFELDVVIGRIHDILEALETKLGTGASTPAVGEILNGTGSGSTDYTSSPTISGGINVGSATGAATGEVKTSAAIRAGGAIYPSNQAVLFGSAPIVGAVVATTASVLIGTNARMGTVRVLNANQGTVAIFSIRGGVDATTLLAGDTASFGTTPAVDNKIHCHFNGGSYYLYNGYGSNQSLYAWFEGL
jgi:hypothetical protein